MAEGSKGMSTRDLVQEALHSLEANKGRSLLTILGIVIGIASVIAMTSLIGGIQNSLVNSLGLNAARMVQIYSSQELTDSDVEKLRKMVAQIEQIGIVDSAYSEYMVGDKSYTVMAQGVDSDMLDAVGASKIVAGRTYSDIESKSGAHVALIGAAAPSNFTATNRTHSARPSRSRAETCRSSALSTVATTPWARSRYTCRARPSRVSLATRTPLFPA